ncbi:MAG: tetratricopeptide repeat protein [Bryobacteraceae bacterium]
MPVLVSLLIALPLFTPPLAAAPPTPASAAQGFDALVRQADQARDAEQLDQALDLYQKALQLKPDWEQGWWAIGTIAYDQDKYDLCAAGFARFVALKPAVSPGWILCGMCEYRLRQYKEAFQSLLHAEKTGFQATPELTRAGRLHLTLLLNRFSEWERAITLLGTQIRAYGRSTELIAAAGIAGLRKPWLPTEVPAADRDLVARLGDAMLSALEMNVKDADQKFEAILQAYPASADVHFRFGAFLMKNEPERGLAEMKRAVELDPQHLPALVSLSIQMLSLGDARAAEAYGRQAVAAGPDNFASHLALGRACLEQHNLPAAVTELEQAARQAPDSPNAHFLLATAYAQSGRKTDADRERSEFQRLKKLVNSSVKSQ